MKCTTLYGSIALLLLGNAAAFAPSTITSNTNSGVVSVSSVFLRAAGELVAIPKGGEEISAVKTMPGSRMNNMEEDEGLIDGRVYETTATVARPSYL